jgi:RNA polymerase sigma-70 factor (ECF subfamily)
MERQQIDIATLLADDLSSNFKLFVTAYQAGIYAFLVRQTGNIYDAEDIAQEAFIQAYYALVDYPAERRRALALRPWLYKIALNIFYKRLRGNRLQCVALDMREESEHVEIEDTSSFQPEIMLEHRELQYELEALLLTLPTQYRAVVNLYYFAGLNYREIADLLALPMGTVKSHLHRGVQLLRTTLATQKEQEQQKQKGR